MESIQMIHPAMPIILAAASILFLFIAVYYARPWLAGIIGGIRIQRQLSLLQKQGATVMNHVQFPSKTGEVVHIDHLIITNDEVVAISMLGYSGEILGSVRSATWIQETPQGRHRFPNPAREHELIKQTIRSFLGSKLEIRTISAFTSGHLQGTVSDEAMTASECAKTMHESVKEMTTGPKLFWASNTIKSVVLKDTDRKAEQERAFISRQGNEQRLKTARYMMATSATLMLFAVTLAAIRSASAHGII